MQHRQKRHRQRDTESVCTEVLHNHDLRMPCFACRTYCCVLSCVWLPLHRPCTSRCRLANHLDVQRRVANQPIACEPIHQP